MFVKTVKLKKPNPIAIIFVVIAIVVFVAVWGIGKKDKAVSDNYVMTDNTQRVIFLTKLGWDVSEKEVDCKIIKVPTEFNAVYNAYNKLQKQQSFDLSKHKGETVEIYTYDVYNYPNIANNIVVHLIISDGKLIAGDVCSTEMDGFIHGLMPVDKKGMDTDGKEQTSTDTGDNSITDTSEDAKDTATTNFDDTAIPQK